MATWLRQIAAMAILTVALGLYIVGAVDHSYNVPWEFAFIFGMVVAALFPEGAAAALKWWRNGKGGKPE